VTTVVVSPHLDDGVLSIPALVRSRAAAGERVVVLTVFSEGDDGYAARRDEDRAALALLGAEPLHLGLADAPYRRALPRTFRGLVLTQLVEGDADAVAVAHVLVDRLAALAPDLILLPLGVGEHVDHRVVHAAHTLLHGSIGFYEDRPYALVRHAVHARLARLGATVDGEPIAPSRTRAEEYLAASRVAPHLQAYLPQVEREACLRPLAESLASPAPASGLVLRRERLAFDPSALDTAARAVRAYGSQVGDLFGDEEVRTALCGERPYAETIYWRGYFSPNRAQ
jgi:LmbE family N-acetylglucosaminyl deacetylase